MAARTAAGLLRAAAQLMAENVATYCPPAVPHISTDGRNPQQRMADAGCPAWTTATGEIIAWGAASASAAMNLWLNSPPHTAVLNYPGFAAAGFGVACWGAYPCVWVVDFGGVVDGSFAAAAPAPPPAPIMPTYHAQFYAQSPFPVASPGQQVQWTIAFTNTGTAGWRIGANEARLGTAIHGTARARSRPDPGSPRIDRRARRRRMSGPSSMASAGSRTPVSSSISSCGERGRPPGV